MVIGKKHKMNLKNLTEFKEQRLYWAYGSNMAPSRILERKLQVRILGIGYLDHYKLMFNKISKKDPTVGFANIVPFWGSRIYGIVYDLADAELVGSRFLNGKSESYKQKSLDKIRENLSILDKAEGYPEHYQRTLVGISMPGTGFKLVQCLTYIANIEMVSKGNLLISEDYIKKINEGLDEFDEDEFISGELINYRQDIKQMMGIWKK